MSKNEGYADVIIPTYQRSFLTLKAVESILAQSYKKVCLYVIEDGSNSFTPIAKQLFLKENDLHYVRLYQNKGVSYARNLGASLGKGDFVAFLDSDDIWLPHKLKLQIEFLQKNKNINWVHCNEIWQKNNRIIKQRREHRKQGGLFVKRMFKRCLISPSAVLFRRFFWEKHAKGFLPSFRVAEDYELWLRLNFEHPVGYLEDPLIIKNGGNWDQLSRSIEIDRQRVLALHRFYLLFKNNPRFKKIQEEWSKEIIRKINILQKGALKYKNYFRLKEYQSWEMLFNKNRILGQL